MLRHIVLLASVPLVLGAVLAFGAVGARAQTSAGDTASDGAPATVQNNATVNSADDGAYGAAATPTVPATTGGAATTRAPGGVLGGAVGTGTLAPSTSNTNNINPSGTNEAMRTGQSTTGGPSSFGTALPPGGFLVPGTWTPGINGSSGTWVPGVGMAPGTVVGSELAGSAAQSPVAIPSGVAVGNDGRPFNARARNVGEGEGESPASADANANPNANANPQMNPSAQSASAAPGVAMPAAVYIVAPGFVPSSAAASGQATGSTAVSTTAADDDVEATPIEVTVTDLAPRAATASETDAADDDDNNDYVGRRVNLRGRVTSVDGTNMFTIAAKGHEIIVVHPSALSDTPLREDVIVTGVVERREDRNVLVAESVIQIER